MKNPNRLLSWVVGLALCSALLGCGSGGGSKSDTAKPPVIPPAIPTLCDTSPAVCLESLSELSISTLADRDYGSELTLLSVARQEGGRDTLIASFSADGIRQYVRIDLPASAAPAEGYPVVVFSHGWIGKQDAPGYSLGLDAESSYGNWVDEFAKAGFVVLSPGFRGHGTFDGVPAEGIEFMDAWDNASYLSPSFYAQDVLNLVAGLPSFGQSNWADVSRAAPALNLARVSMVAHSQGGDVALTALAIAGAKADFPVPFYGASLWASNIADKFTQLETFGPMGGTRRAFLAGDGTWTGTAVGANGEVNTDFVFGFPPDWIETPNPLEWTWQHDSFPDKDVLTYLTDRYETMYQILGEQVANLDGVYATISRDANANIVVQHAQAVAESYASISAYPQASTVKVRLNLHFSDRDYYSLPIWNHGLRDTMVSQGRDAYAFEYTGVTHSLGVSPRKWFSPQGTLSAVACAVARDTALFTGQDPQALSCN